jgi:hypothetical protein
VNRFSKWSSCGLGAAILGVVLASVSCGTSSSSDRTQMRVVHLAPSPGPVDLLIDNKSVSSNIAYGVPTAFVSIAPGKHDLKFNQPGSSINLFDNPAENFAGGTSYTYLFIESPGPAFPGNKLADDHSKPTKGMFKIRVVNGSPTFGSVDVYLIAQTVPPAVAAPDCSMLNTFTPAPVPAMKGLGANAASTYQTLATGTYNICITKGGDNTTVLVHFDGLSGTTSPIFTDGQIRTLIMKNQIPITSTPPYDTITLTDLN